GLKIAITFAVIGAVIGEFVGSENGLGYLILVSTSQSRTPLAFGALVLLTVMSIVLYYGIAFIERIVVPWAPRNWDSVAVRRCSSGARPWGISPTASCATRCGRDDSSRTSTCARPTWRAGSPSAARRCAKPSTA